MNDKPNAATVPSDPEAIRAAGFEEPEVSLRPAVEALSADDPVLVAVQEGVEKLDGCGCGSLSEVADSVASAQVVARKPE